jgi:hypothetical protein
LASPRTEPNLWAVFASPGLLQQIILDRTTGRIFSQPQGIPVSDQQIAIPPVDREEFRGIAENFLNIVPADVKEDLRSILDRPEFIYQNWISLLREKYPSHHHRWGLHRVQAIIDLFRKRLQATGIPQDQAEATVGRLVADQSATFKERLLARSRLAWQDASAPIPSWQEPPRPRRPPGVDKQEGPGDLRAVIKLAIDELSLTELRQLRIPLGAIIDAGLLFRK